MAIFGRIFSRSGGRIYSIMNEDHAELYRIVSRLQEISARKCRTNDDRERARVECLDVIASLIRESAAHFKREEGLMARYEYPLLRQHAMEHVVLMRTVENFDLRLRTEREPITADDVGYLKEWLTRHIRNGDKHLESFLAHATDKRTVKRKDLSQPGHHPLSFLFSLNDGVPEGVATANRSLHARHEAQLEERRLQEATDYELRCQDAERRRWLTSIWYE